MLGPLLRAPHFPTALQGTVAQVQQAKQGRPEEEGLLRLDRRSPDRLHVATQSDPNGIAHPDHDRHIHQRSAHVGREEGAPGKFQAPRKGTGQEAQPDDEPRQEHGDRPVVLDETAHRLESGRREAGPKSVARDDGLSVPAANPIAETIPCHRAHDPDQEDQREMEAALPCQLTGHPEHRLLRDGEPEVAEQDKHQETEVAPLADQGLETFHGGMQRGASRSTRQVSGDV